MVAKALASSTILPTILLKIIIVSTFPSPTVILSQNDPSYDYCSPFTCGNINFSFPFYSSDNPQCGLPGFQITCEPPASIPHLLVSDRPYRVKDLYISESDRLITVVDTQLVDELSNNSCDSLYNVSINSDANSIASLTFPSWSVNSTLYKCPLALPDLPPDFTDKVVRNFSCNDDYRLYLWINGSQSNPTSSSPEPLTPTGCDFAVRVQISSVNYLSILNTSDDNSMRKLVDALDDGFPLEWSELKLCETCQNSSGRCGYDWKLKKFDCYHHNASTKHSQWQRQLLIAGVAIGSSFIVLIVVLLVVFRNRISPFFKKSYWTGKTKPGDHGLNTKQFIKTYRSTLLTNHSYNDVRKMTLRFKEKLGAGGYGNVYKGKFPDGRLVAVKVLEKSDEISQNFINEVATIGRIHHVNIINLLGFCCDGSKRALLYEYMSKGSLGDLLSREEACLSLGLVKLHEIALAVAHAIEYLHNGCELRILHLDIKPQNVLLDQDFNPKISDFGLAKVHSRNRSVVTMTGARGTIGYIAPEIFLRNLGSPSNKSDVYSYGMLLLEMVGGRKQAERSMTSTEAYFPDWIYNKLIEDISLMEEDKEEELCIARKMVMVGLWCIQINPRDRPPMARVLEMLSGSVEAIAMPPKPCFFSPSPVQIQNEVTSIDSDTSELPLTFDKDEINLET